MRCINNTCLFLCMNIPIFLCVFQLLRKCILNMTIPCVVPDGPLGVPPFEKPSIAKVIFTQMLNEGNCVRPRPNT